MIVCDATVPSYDAMNYEPEQLIITRETPPPPVAPPPDVDPPEVPPTGDLGGEEDVPCPGPAQLRVGDVTQSGDEKVIGHELSDDGKTCVTLYEDTSPLEKYVPSCKSGNICDGISSGSHSRSCCNTIIDKNYKTCYQKTMDYSSEKIW